MKKLYISVSVDWEGEDFSSLRQLQQMRHEMEKAVGHTIPFTHYICPSYFTDKVSRSHQSIRSTVTEFDEIGLHVHAWKTLVEAAGLTFTTEGDFHAGKERAGSGHGVPVGVYGEDTVKLIRYAKELLEYELELSPLESFRCGGWMAGDAVIRALMATGFTSDSSTGPAAQFSRGFGKKGKSIRFGNGKDSFGEDNGLLREHTMKLWGYQLTQDPHYLSNKLVRSHNPDDHIHWLSQPFLIKEKGSELIEFPHPFTSDYSTCNTVWPHFERLARGLGSAVDASPLFFHMACHQEGDRKYKQPLVEFANRFAKWLKQNQQFKEQIEWVTIQQSVQALSPFLEKARS